MAASFSGSSDVQFVVKSVNKLVQIILQSRVAFPNEAPRQNNDSWLNLITDELSEIRTQVEDELRKSVSCALRLDMFVHSPELPQQILLERWNLRLDRLNISMDQRQLAVTLNRMRLLARNLYSSLRLLPAASLFRMTSQSPDDASFAINYVSTWGSIVAGVFLPHNDSISNPAPSGLVFDGPTGSLVYAPVEIGAQSNKFEVSVTYRHDCDFDFSQRSKLIGISPIILDYVGSDNKDTSFDINSDSKEPFSPPSQTPSAFPRLPANSTRGPEPVYSTLSHAKRPSSLATHASLPPPLDVVTPTPVPIPVSVPVPVPVQANLASGTSSRTRVTGFTPTSVASSASTSASASPSPSFVPASASASSFSTPSLISALASSLHAPSSSPVSTHRSPSLLGGVLPPRHTSLPCSLSIAQHPSSHPSSHQSSPAARPIPAAFAATAATAATADRAAFSLTVLGLLSGGRGDGNGHGDGDSGGGSGSGSSLSRSPASSSLAQGSDARVSSLANKRRLGSYNNLAEQAILLAAQQSASGHYQSNDASLSSDRFAAGEEDDDAGQPVTPARHMSSTNPLDIPDVAHRGLSASRRHSPSLGVGVGSALAPLPRPSQQSRDDAFSFSPSSLPAPPIHPSSPFHPLNAHSSTHSSAHNSAHSKHTPPPPPYTHSLPGHSAASRASFTPTPPGASGGAYELHQTPPVHTPRLPSASAPVSASASASASSSRNASPHPPVLMSSSPHVPSSSSSAYQSPALLPAVVVGAYPAWAASPAFSASVLSQSPPALALGTPTPAAMSTVSPPLSDRGANSSVLVFGRRARLRQSLDAGTLTQSTHSLLAPSLAASLVTPGGAPPGLGLGAGPGSLPSGSGPSGAMTLSVRSNLWLAETDVAFMPPSSGGGTGPIGAAGGVSDAESALLSWNSSIGGFIRLCRRKPVLGAQDAPESSRQAQSAEIALEVDRLLLVAQSILRI